MGSNAQTSCESSLIFLSFHEILSFSRSPTTSLCLPRAKHSPHSWRNRRRKREKIPSRTYASLLMLSCRSPAAGETERNGNPRARNRHKSSAAHLPFTLPLTLGVCVRVCVYVCRMCMLSPEGFLFLSPSLSSRSWGDGCGSRMQARLPLCLYRF